MSKLIRANVIVAASLSDALLVKKRMPQFKFHVVLTPGESLSGFAVREYVWTPAASNLPAVMRMELRGLLAPLIDDDSIEEEFPETLLTW